MFRKFVSIQLLFCFCLHLMGRQTHSSALPLIVRIFCFYSLSRCLVRSHFSSFLLFSMSHLTFIPFFSPSSIFFLSYFPSNIPSLPIGQQKPRTPSVAPRFPHSLSKISIFCCCCFSDAQLLGEGELERPALCVPCRFLGLCH